MHHVIIKKQPIEITILIFVLCSIVKHCDLISNTNEAKAHLNLFDTLVLFLIYNNFFSECRV